MTFFQTCFNSSDRVMLVHLSLKPSLCTRIHRDVTETDLPLKGTRKVQGGLLPVVNGVISPMNGLINV